MLTTEMNFEFSAFDFECARKFALTEFTKQGQKWGDFEYKEHLDRVHLTLLEMSNGSLSLVDAILAYLHDTAEDCEVTKSVFLLEMQKFNKESTSLKWDYIWDCLEVLSDPKGLNRKERKKAMNEKLQALKDKHYVSVLRVKLADRLVNVLFCLEQADKGKKLLKMYLSEMEDFLSACRKSCAADDAICRKLMAKLEHLAKGKLVRLN